MLSKTGCRVWYYGFARNPTNHARDYQVHAVGRGGCAATHHHDKEGRGLA